MKNEKLIHALRLINTEGIGPVHFFKLLEKEGSLQQAILAVEDSKKVPDTNWAQDEIERAADKNAQIVLFDDPLYPQSLKNVYDAPPVLYMLGDVSLANYPVSVSIVGARNATIAGRKMASRLAYDLTEHDVLIISGMARGIDSAAHKGALYANNQSGPTIAVLGTGVDVVYPTENHDLYRKIRENGLIISEFPMNTSAQSSNFPRRNRIISALSSATVIVEAGLHSGSLITAKLALEQGKDIFAVPGSPLDPRSAGPNHLIKEGAILTESADDILEVIRFSPNELLKNYQNQIKPLDKVKNNVNIPEQKKVLSTPTAKSPLLDLISYEGVDIDELLRTCGLPQAEFFEQILDLEYTGKIERQVGNRVARIK